jgi:hypothetical protein
MEAIRDFEGDIKSLASSDQYFKEVRKKSFSCLSISLTLLWFPDSRIPSQIMIIPRLSERLTCMTHRRRFEMDLEELRPELAVLRFAADELRTSVNFKKLLQVSADAQQHPPSFC